MKLQKMLLMTALLVSTRPAVLGQEPALRQVEFFENRIRPVLIRHCYECHSAAASEVQGGLRLDSRDLIRKGGETGPAVVPGDPGKSLLLQAIRHESLEMPPAGKLPQNVISDFESWVRAGAADPRDHPPSDDEVADLSWRSVLAERRDWWSLQPLARTNPPIDAVENPVDAFISFKQQAAGIRAAATTNPHVLARRLSLVLTGLPPSPDLVHSFLIDWARDPDAACEALVDRILQSEHYGEHWARHWMDVVRFAETHGYEWNHEIRDAWRYRDYLIRAFNSDLPYDQLVREHIAGDLLETPRFSEKLKINESVIGTAFWRFGELGHDDCVEFPEIRFDAIDNQIDTFSKTFQALTISCARCHDHKVDAISTKDYYALVGVLESCSQVVHTLDSPRQLAGAKVRMQQIKRQLRQLMGLRWLATMEQAHNDFLASIDGSAGIPAQLKERIASDKLDPSDPGYVLRQLARRDAGTADRFSASTSDLRDAHWLWYPEGNAAADAPIESRYFRRRFVIPGDRRISMAVCFFAGDDSIRFYVNGTHIGTGNSHRSLTGVDLSDKLRIGINDLAAANTNGNPAIQPNPAGWIGVLRVEFEHGEPLLIYSDAGWMSSRTARDDWTTAEFTADNWVAAMELGKAGISPWGFPWPNQSPVRRPSTLQEVWFRLRDEYAAEDSRRFRFNADNFDVWADFRTEQASDWRTSGLGLAGGPSRPGEFTLTMDGNNVVSAVLPAGLYTDIFSDRLNGSLRSPWVPKNRKYVSVQIVGDGRSMIRPVVDTCGLNEFAGGGLQYLAGRRTFWKRLPTSAGGAHRSFIELTTKSDNPRWPDRPGRAGTNDPHELNSPRSSFGVMRAVLHDTPSEPLPELAHLRPLFSGRLSVGAEDIATAFQSAARSAVAAWQDDRATDADVFWINWLLETELLPNTIANDQQLADLLAEYRKAEAAFPEPRVVAGLADHGHATGFPVLQGGDPESPLKVVRPRYLEVLADTSLSLSETGSGRRELAELISSRDNPLTARVMVNRIWHHLFGRGIVSTPDNFGAMGDLPTHPQLLDFLAVQFVEDGWSVKRLIRRIVLSRTFRQSSLPHKESAAADPANRLLHHFPSRRIAAESIRDNILTVSGRLDRTLFGPGVHPWRKDEIDYRKLLSGPLDGNGRRSIYTKVTRMEGPQFLELFDFPNPMSTRGRRDRTNVPAQALALLNDPFVIQQAEFWAHRLVANDDRTVEQRVRRMFARALGRPPDDAEERRFVDLLRQLAGESTYDDVTDLLKNVDLWQDAAHALFNMKEFVYIR